MAHAIKMAKKGITPIFLSWMKLIWNFAWCPASSFGLKETRKPVAFGLLLLLCIYFIPELYLFLIVDNAAPGVHLPITTNTTESPCNVAPYCVISAKGLFQGPTDFYIQKPLAILTNRAFHIDSFLSANFVSLTHIITALISSRLIASDSLIVRRIGVFVYELRNFLDCLDGVVAKEEHKRAGNMHATNNQPNGVLGYFIDGISDGLGCIFLLTACLFHLQRQTYQRKIQQKIYSPLNAVPVPNNGVPCCGGMHKKKGKRCDADRDVEAHLIAQNNSGIFASSCVRCLEYLSMCGITAAGIPAFLFLNQLLLSSIFWNRNIILYGRLLEPTSISPGASVVASDQRNIESVASKLIHSPFMWLVIFSWRIFNPMFMSEILLLFIFMDKMHECLHLFKYSGYLIISFIAAISEVHRLTDSTIHGVSKL